MTKMNLSRRRRTLAPLVCLAALCLLAGSSPAQVPNFEWARMADGPVSTTPQGVATDNAGSVYVTGEFRDTVTLGTNSLSQLLSGFRNQFFIAKMDSAGNCLWLKGGAVTGGNTIYGTSLGLGRAVAVDKHGAIYLAGIFNGRIDFSTTNFSSSASNGWATFIVKYAPTGTIVWAIKVGDFEGGDVGIAAGEDGSIHVVGAFEGTARFGSTNLISAGSSDMFHAKLDTSGGLIWVRTAGGTYADYADAVAVDSQGNSFMAGGFSGAVQFGGTLLNGNPQNGVGGYDLVSAFVVKYDPAGDIVWASQISDGSD